MPCDQIVLTLSLSDDELKTKLKENKNAAKVDSAKLANLIKRRQVFGDIVQNATETQLEYLLVLHENKVPCVIKSLQDWVKTRGSHMYTPPAFYDRDGTFVRPPTLELPTNYVPYN